MVIYYQLLFELFFHRKYVDQCAFLHLLRNILYEVYICEDHEKLLLLEGQLSLDHGLYFPERAAGSVGRLGHGD